MKKKTAIVLGAGFTGCTIAHLLSKNNWEVTVIEKEAYTGGGVRTFTYGGHSYTLGPRVFHCPSSRMDIYNFMNDIVPLKKIKHYLMTYVEQDRAFYSYPIHEDDISRMPDKEKIYSELKNRSSNKDTPSNFEEFWTKYVGKTLYEKYIKEYSKKMWAVGDNKEITDFSRTTKGDAIKNNTREVLIYDWLNAYPESLGGYNKYFERCTENTDLILNCELKEFDIEKKKVKVGDEWKSADIIVSTIPPDELMKNAYGELPFMGRDFVRIVLPCERVLPEYTQFLYNPNQKDFLRAVEYKHLTGYVSDSTLLVLEFPSDSNKLYPFPIKKYQDRAEKYLNALPEGIYSLGRLGLYKYTNLWEIISTAFTFVRQIK